MIEQNETPKIPLFCEVIGEPEAGKTHLACLFPDPVVLDTTPRKEAYMIVRKLHSDWKLRYYPVRSLKDIRDVLAKIKSGVIKCKTVVIDTAVDLQVMAADEYLKQAQAKKPERSAVSQIEYRWVREKVDELIDEITAPDKLGRNCVFVAQMKDEWVGGRDGHYTGRRIRAGYKKTPFHANMRLYLQIERKEVEGGGYVYERKCRVVKNTFRDKASKEWKEMLEDMSWKSIVELTGMNEEELVA